MGLKNKPKICTQIFLLFVKPVALEVYKHIICNIFLVQLSQYIMQFLSSEGKIRKPYNFELLVSPYSSFTFPKARSFVSHIRRPAISVFIINNDSLILPILFHNILSISWTKFVINECILTICYLQKIKHSKTVSCDFEGSIFYSSNNKVYPIITFYITILFCGGGVSKLNSSCYYLVSSNKADIYLTKLGNNAQQHLRLVRESHRVTVSHLTSST